MVTLHGGDLGGQQVERSTWGQVGDTQAIGKLLYRLDAEDFAVFVGYAK